MAKKKYICIGGWVISAHDDDEHYVSPRRLPHLYGVNPESCIFVRKEEDARGLRLEGNIEMLRPQPSGRYYNHKEVSQ